MKKIFIAFLCGILFLSTFGFSSQPQQNIIDNTIYSHAVLNDTNKVTETFAVNLNKVRSIFLLKENIKIHFEQQLSKIVLDLKQKITPETDESVKEVLGTVEENDNIVCIKITYANLDAWKFFSNSGNNKKTEKRLFTYDYYDQIGRVGGLTTLDGEEKLIAEYIEEDLFELLEILIPSFEYSEMDKSSYTYITTLKRRHSNADSIMCVNDLYYHQWYVNQQTDVQFWITQPVLVSWYVLAVIASLIVFTVCFVTGIIINKRNKKNKELEQDEQDVPNKPIMLVKIENNNDDEQKNEE